jgi:DNA adenine methylase
VAGIVWEALGDVRNYVEPFFGSGATLFLRPGGLGHIETVNDADGLIANFWRSVQIDPDAVAYHADNPVNECDLHARHLWLTGQRERITERLMGDPDFCDPKAAGWWAWGMSCWIGSGWCTGTGPWTTEDGVMVLRNPGQGVNRQLPHLHPGKGVNRQLPHLGDPGQGINRQLPHLGDPGKGVNRQLPHLGDPGKERLGWLRTEIGRFATRLRNVRVCCGDWARVCGPSVTVRHGLTGVFLDPPYADTATRTAGLYAMDSEAVAHDTRVWAIEQGQNPLMRIVLAGYQDEHAMPDDWTVVEWQAAGGYGLIGEDEAGIGRANRRRERLWLSPGCVRVRQGHLFQWDGSDALAGDVAV